MTEQKNIDAARSWIASDPQAVRGDVTRLGFAAAAAYQLELIAERGRDGDSRWADVTGEAMAQALREIG